MKYKELLEELQGLSEEQLEQDVTAWSEGGTIKSALLLSEAGEDYIYAIDDDSECCVLRSEMIESVGEDAFSEDDHLIGFKKGTLFLWME